MGNFKNWIEHLYFRQPLRKKLNKSALCIVFRRLKVPVIKGFYVLPFW